MSTRVLVTGATGFVAGHCIAELLRHGYEVRATVRDLGAVWKRAYLVDLAEDTGGRLEFTEADLGSDAGWADAVAGCAFVLHVASPFPSTPPDDENELIRPAVDGALRVLRACADETSVRRVVLTSSATAIAYGHRDDEVRTEKDWTVVERSSAYAKSKTLAERAAWDFVAGLPADRGLDLVVLNPGMVLGPVLHASAVSTSHEPVRRLLAGKVPGTIRVGWATVDVRDLAVAHRLALETPGAAGNRYVCGGDNVWMRDMARTLAERFGPRGFRITTRQLPDWLVRVIARFDRGVALTLPNLGHPERLSAAKARHELGWTMRPIRDTVLDTAESLLSHGVVTAPGTTRPACPASASGAPAGQRGA